MQLAKPVKAFWVQEMNLNYEGILHQYKETATGYTMEFAIPWSIINTIPENDKEVGFNIVVNDDDEPEYPYNQPSQLLWVGNETYFQSTQNWGTIVLSNTPVNFSDSYLALKTPNNGEFLINNKQYEISWFQNAVDFINIEYSTNNGTSWNSLITNVEASSGVYEWLVDCEPTDQLLIKISDASNANVSDQSDSPNIVSAALDLDEPLIPSLWQNYRWPYNAYFPEDINGINGHLGNGCGPSSLARIIHSWEYPRRGSNSLSFTDYNGYYWSADFGNTIYNYDNMPVDLPENATENEYTDVATLFLHAQVAMDDFYGTGTDLENMSFAMSNYFNYKESEPVHMIDYTPAEWTQLLIDEIDNGRSLLVQGMSLEYFNDWHTSNGIAGHWYHCDGYNENGEFHIIVGFGNYQYDGYYTIEEFPLYGYNVGILIGLEPDLQGKSLSLISPAGGESFVAGEPIEIVWQSAAVSEVQLEYTIDNGQNWTTIVDAVNASTGVYTWTTPEVSADQCKIRVTDTENINIYDKSIEVFSLVEIQLELMYPLGSESFVSSDKVYITWQETPVESINIEFSGDNGLSWSTVSAGADASQQVFEWIVSQSETTEGIIRITDSNNSDNWSSSASFNIASENMIGGPYSNDEHTMLLLHAEGNLVNQSDNSDDAEVVNSSLGFQNSALPELGKAFFMDNTNPYLLVPHTNSLSMTENWTIELWFKPESFNQGLQYLVWKPGDNDEYFSNYSLQLNGYWDNELYGFYFSGDDRIGLNFAFFPELNSWYHVAFIRDTENETLTITVRNTEREVISSATIPDSGIEPLINVQDLLLGFNFYGYMDEIRISDIVRSFDPSNTDYTDTKMDIILRPNPAINSLSLNNTTVSDLEIKSLDGAIVMKINHLQPNGTVNISELSSGIYMATINSGQQRFTTKLVVVK